MTQGQTIGRVARVMYMTGCVVAILCALAHTAASLQDPQPGSEQERLMLDAMATVKIDALRKMGAERTMLDITNGFSWHWTWSVAACGLACMALRFWRKDDAGLLRFSAVCAAVFFAVALGLSLRYFFFVPTGFLTACVVCFGVAAATARPASTELQEAAKK
jgi:CHASE2 domain-containing sensor protein